MWRRPKQPKRLKGYLTFKLQNGLTERCLVECKSKKGVDGLMREIVQLADGFHASTELTTEEKYNVQLSYEGDHENPIRMELELIVKTICAALGLATLSQ